MAIGEDHITGFAVGLGAAAVGFYAYRKNQARVDQWLKQQGISVPTTSSQDPAAMTLEELVREKETLEDAIAEREMGGGQETAAESS